MSAYPGFAARAFEAAVSAVDDRAQLVCEAAYPLAATPRQQYALAALAAAFRLAAKEDLTELQEAADAFDTWLVAAAKPARRGRKNSDS